jgi:hypothetical protein
MAREIRSRITASILLLLSEKCMSTRELAESIGVDTKTLWPYLHYYSSTTSTNNNNNRLLQRIGFLWCLTDAGRETVERNRTLLERVVNSFDTKDVNSFNTKDIHSFSRLNLYKFRLKISKFRNNLTKLEHVQQKQTCL